MKAKKQIEKIENYLIETGLDNDIDTDASTAEVVITLLERYRKIKESVAMYPGYPYLYWSQQRVEKAWHISDYL